MKRPHILIGAAAGLGLALCHLPAAANDLHLRDVKSGSIMTALQQPLKVGDILSPNQLRIVDEPGVYGLSLPPPGDRYAIVDDQLVRIDPVNGKVLSILRRVDRNPEYAGQP